MRRLLGLGLGLTLAACAGGQPQAAALAKAASPTTVVSPGASEVTTAADAPAKPENTRLVPAVERRIAWYGLSLDLSDAWLDQTNYGFEAAQGVIEKLVFEPSELPSEHVRTWLEEVRRRVDGMYGARPSVVEVFENPSFTALGVRISIKPQYLYDVFVTLDDRVLGLTFKCRAECDADVRGIVRSLSQQEPANAPGSRHRYRIPGLVFDSRQLFDAPREFVLGQQGGEQGSEPRVFCSRKNTAPPDSELPSKIHWSLATNDALTKLPRVEEALTRDGSALNVRLYHREGYVPDELGQTVFASSSSAVITLGSDTFTCHLRALPSSRPLLTHFHRLFETARPE